MTRLQEAQDKIEQLRKAFLSDKVGGILVSEQPNFSYLTAGARGFLGLASVKACASLLITRERVTLVANNIEAGRLMHEELPEGLCDCAALPWWDETLIAAKVAELAGTEYLTDSTTAVAAWLKDARMRFTEQEIARYRELSAVSADAMEKVLHNVKPGMSEYQVAGLLSSALWSAGVEPISLFVAADERKSQVRHFIPTDKCAQHCFIASICGRKAGLVVSITRSVYFQPPTEEEIAGYRGLLHVESALFDALRPGNDQSALWTVIQDSYKESGMEEEWKNHHQGGTAGYLARETKVDIHTAGTVQCGQIYAFNPSCPQAKLEDTVMVTEKGVEILSKCGDWPTLEVGGRLRPDLLVLE